MAIVREAVTEINRGDWDAAIARMAPDFEYDLTRTESPLRGVHPRERVRDVAADFLGGWERARYEAADLIIAGEHVVMPFTTHFLGRDGLELQTNAVWVWTFRGDEVTRLTLFQDRAEAMAAAGLAE